MAPNSGMENEVARSKAQELIGLALLMLLWGLSVFAWLKLPDTIPIHFNAKGETDGYGSKHFLWLLPAIGTATFIGLTVLSRFPQYFNYPVTITDENRERQYQNAVGLVRSLKLIVLGIFTLITGLIYLTASRIIESPGIWLLPLVLAAIFIPVGWTLFRASKRMKP